MVIEKLAEMKEEAESNISGQDIDIEKELNDFKGKFFNFVSSFIFSFCLSYISNEKFNQPYNLILL